MTNRPAERDFFATTWQTYQTVVEHDYLWHAMAGEALRKIIDQSFRDRPIRFLDLACGDAASTSRVLADHPLAKYIGVDRSRQALTAADQHVKAFGAKVDLVEADYVDFLARCDETFDVIYVGLSSHHLDDAGLPRMFAGVRRCLAKNGVFAAFEPFLLSDEIREDHIERLCTIIDHWWVKMSTQQLEGIKAHIRANDHPIPIDRWNAMANDAGLGPASIAMKTPDRISMLVVHGGQPNPPTPFPLREGGAKS